MPNTSFKPAETELGALLRYWRQQRGKSQLDLALDASVSQRHISFVESGRSTPSRDLLIGLAETLDIPLRERNTLLLASGYAPIYTENAWDTPEMAAISHAIDCVLQQHEPHPALVLDRYWNVLRTNAASPRFFGQFVDLDSLPKPRNLLYLIFDPMGVRPFIENWNAVATALLQRVRREAIGHILDQKTLAIIKELETYPGVKDLASTGKSHAPIIPITFIKDGRRQSFFSLITTVGTPQDVTAQELRIECMYPVASDS